MITRDLYVDARAAAEAAVGTLLKKRAPGERDDLLQHATSVTLAAARNWDPSRGVPIGAYLYRAALRSTGNYVSQNLAVTSIGRDWGAGKGQRRVPADKVRLPGTGDPELALLGKERERMRTRWRVRFRRAFERALQGMGEEDRAAVERCWGLDGLPAARPSEVARQLGIDAAAVVQAQREARRLLAASMELYRLGRTLEEEGGGG